MLFGDPRTVRQTGSFTLALEGPLEILRVYKYLPTSCKVGPTSYKWSYNPYKWLYKLVIVVITLFIGVITPLVTGSGGPPCGTSTEFILPFFVLPWGGQGSDDRYFGTAAAIKVAQVGNGMGGMVPDLLDAHPTLAIACNRPMVWYGLRNWKVTGFLD